RMNQPKSDSQHSKTKAEPTQRESYVRIDYLGDCLISYRIRVDIPKYALSLKQKKCTPGSKQCS
ncbi:MAG: hypothetical protein ACKO9Q_30095, partial [Pirellula sp.]